MIVAVKPFCCWNSQIKRISFLRNESLSWFGTREKQKTHTPLLSHVRRLFKNHRSELEREREKSSLLTSISLRLKMIVITIIECFEDKPKYNNSIGICHRNGNKCVHYLANEVIYLWNKFCMKTARVKFNHMTILIWFSALSSDMTKNTT